MKCEEVMWTLVFKCDEHTTVEDCARLMRDEALGFLPVLDARWAVVGVVTDRDLTLRVLAEALPPSTPVREVMTRGPFLTCLAEEELRELEARMAESKRSRALVNEPDGTLLGLISLSDIAQREPSVTRTGRLLRELTRPQFLSLARLEATPH